MDNEFVDDEDLFYALMLCLNLNLVFVDLASRFATLRRNQFKVCKFAVLICSSLCLKYVR